MSNIEKVLENFAKYEKVCLSEKSINQAWRKSWVSTMRKCDNCQESMGKCAKNIISTVKAEKPLLGYLR